MTDRAPAAGGTEKKEASARPRRRGKPDGKSKPSAARVLAAESGIESESRKASVRDILERKLRERPAGRKNRALAESIALGSVRRRASIDAVLAAFSRKPLKSITPPLLTILRQAAYQVIYLDKVPAFAVVNDAAQLARKLVTASSVSFVNGLLRALCRGLAQKAEGKPGEKKFPCTVQIGAGRYAVFTKRVLPKAGGYSELAAWYSAPEWLVARLFGELGREQAAKVLEWSVMVPPVFVRLVPRLAEGREPAQIFDGAAALRKCKTPNCFMLRPTAAVDTMPGFASGAFTVQDESAQRVVLALKVPEGATVLDVCAAPGGKTTHLAELVGPTGNVLAVDISPDRIELVQRNASRLRLSNIETQVADARDLPPTLHGSFDFVLADVPCSNLGVMSRRVEVRWRVTPESVTELAHTQSVILRGASLACAPGGRLAYSTCTILREENEGVVDEFLASGEGRNFVCESKKLLLPSPGAHDGGFVAMLHRKR